MQCNFWWVFSLNLALAGESAPHHLRISASSKMDPHNRRVIDDSLVADNYLASEMRAKASPNLLFVDEGRSKSRGIDDSLAFRNYLGSEKERERERER
ncbi:unnamed protein product [Linum tenue]|uniref:Uncharacterized protein n=1 Tax=Linum tenue TaxID=586396 RepID=A0AAV0RD38_9ROSI|nr:unnamed protein product [Linum tenue]